MGAFQEIENIFLEVRTSIDLSFVEERFGASRFDLTSDLPCDPSVLGAMTYEYKQLVPRNLDRHRNSDSISTFDQGDVAPHELLDRQQRARTVVNRLQTTEPQQLGE